MDLFLKCGTSSGALWGKGLESELALELTLLIRRGIHLKGKVSNIFFYSLIYSVCLKQSPCIVESEK